MCINLVRLPPRDFHILLLTVSSKVNLPDTCLKLIFVFFKTSYSKHKSLMKNVHPFDKSFVFLYHLSEFISDHQYQVCENYIYISEFSSLNVCVVLLMGGGACISHSALLTGPGKGSLSCDSSHLVHSHSTFVVVELQEDMLHFF